MRRGLVGALVASAALIAVPALAQEYHYVKVAEIYLPTSPGHGDITTFDPTNGMLYVSLVGDGLAVVDTRTNTVAHVIRDVPDPNGNDYDANYVYVAAAEGLPQGMSGGAAGTGFGTRNELVVIDKHTWQVTDRVETWPHGTTPDGVTVGDGHVYVVMDDNNVMDVYSEGAHPQFEAQWQLEPRNTNSWWLNTADYCGPDVNYYSHSRKEIFQTVTSYMEILDANSGAVKRLVDTHVPLVAHCGTKQPWLDEQSNTLWVPTSTKVGGLLIMNPDTLAIERKLPQSSGKDAIAIDKGLGIVYTFGGKGFDAYNMKTYQHIAYVNTTVPVTHTGDVNPATHEVYVYEGKRAAIGVFKPVPGPGPNGMWQMSAAAPMMGGSSYTVYFAFNSATLTPDARKIVGEAAMSAKHGATRLEVDGYTDLSGTAQYNMGLSMRRANAVRAELVADGISPRRISVHAFGKTHPAVPTPDGVREPRNRRAVVVVGPAMS